MLSGSVVNFPEGITKPCLVFRMGNFLFWLFFELCLTIRFLHLLLQLTQHLATHNGVKKHKCDQCTAAFSCAANLKMHLKSHMDIRDYTCHICGRGFYRPDALKKHLLCYHANLKAFHCSICNKMFKGHLPQHMRTHLKVRPHGCAVCGSVFSQRSQLIVHQRIHSGERPYRCQVRAYNGELFRCTS